MDKTYIRKTGLITLIMSLIMFSPILMHLMGYRIPMFEHLGLTTDTFAPWYVWIFMLVVTLSYVIFTFRAIPFVYKMQSELSFFKLVGLLTIVGGVLEEVVFRRWLMDLLMGFGYGFVLQILISGILFGLAHIIWGFFGRDRQFLIGSFLSTTFLGFALAIVYLIGDRNIGPCIISHSLINIIIEPWLLLSAISKTWKTNKE
jgi:membrane protease YdiL (CAAX protease family)